jgi:integrase/recombinase XerD
MSDLASIINQLTPANKQLIEQLIRGLAQQNGVKIAEAMQIDPITYVSLWIANLKSEGKSPRTIAGYVTDVRRYLAHDPRPTATSIEVYVAKRLETVSASRVGNEQKALKSFFGYLRKRELWATNPCADMRLVREARREIECPTDAEITALLNHRLCRHEDDQKFALMLVLLINTGLRMEEARSTQRQHIDLKQQEIRVLGKGNKERTVPISAFVAGLLAIYMQQNSTTTPYLFPANTKEGYWGHSGFWKALKLACKKVGIRPLHPHMLRHYFATRMLEDGAKLEVISRMLGHTSIAITADVYRHIQAQEYRNELMAHDPLKRLSLPKRGGDTA